MISFASLFLRAFVKEETFILRKVLIFFNLRCIWKVCNFITVFHTIFSVRHSFYKILLNMVTRVSKAALLILNKIYYVF